MKKLVVFLFFTQLIFAQKSGLTFVPDSSYSNAKAALDNKLTHVDAKLVPELVSDKIQEKRNLTYTALGDQKLKFDAFWPKENANGIGIVIIHGGGWRTGDRSQHIPLAQHLAALGYSCFTVQYRLSTHALFPAAVQDLKTAIQYLKIHASDFAFDPKKTVALGFSAGGQLAALIGSTNGESDFEPVTNSEDASVAAFVDLDGILAFIHPESGEGDDTKRLSAATAWFGYAKAEKPELWHQGSALTYAGPNTVPCLFINSSVDRMHAGRDDFRAILTKNNIYSEVQTFADAPHSFVQFSPWFSPMVNYIDQFLNKIFKQ